jgi:hypothetical protein
MNRFPVVELILPVVSELADASFVAVADWTNAAEAWAFCGARKRVENAAALMHTSARIWRSASGIWNLEYGIWYEFIGRW